MSHNFVGHYSRDTPNRCLPLTFSVSLQHFKLGAVIFKSRHEYYEHKINFRKAFLITKKK